MDVTRFATIMDRLFIIALALQDTRLIGEIQLVLPLIYAKMVMVDVLTLATTLDQVVEIVHAISGICFRLIRNLAMLLIYAAH